MGGRLGFALVALVGFLACAQAQEKKDEPRLTGLVPLEVSPGAEVTLKFRGLKLDTATEVRFPTQPALKAELKDKKKADLPTGLEAKDVGDTRCEATVKLPADLAPGVFAVELVTPTATIRREIRVQAADALLEEKEPNNGFREAQPLDLGKTLRGQIREDKDVDVFVFEARAKQKFAIEVLAARALSMLDPVLTIYDEHGRILKSSDDNEGRDPKLTFQAPVDGKFMIAIQDAGDRGGTWHAYQLTVKEEK
jgi:hypothetical protein